jgi:hypothetical protein
MTDAFKSDWEPGDFITTVTDDKTVDTGFAAALAGDNRRRSVEPRAAGVPTRAPGGRSMSTGNAMADVQTGQEVVLPERMPAELTEPKFTAAQIENDCPVRLQDLAKRITEGLEKVCEQKKLADDQEIAVKKLIAEVKALCDVGGFAAFRERFFPNLRKSRVY